MEPTEKTAGQFEVVSLPNPADLEREITREREPISRLERVAVAYPSGNTTAIVFGQLPDYDPRTLNGQIMRAWKTRRPDQPEIEQCCIVTQAQDPDAIARVQMLGDEFCGNATRSALRLLAGGQWCTGLVEVSGVDRLLTFNIRNKEVQLEMPLPRGGELVRRVNEGWLVQLDGITQLVTTPEPGQTPRQLLEGLLRNNAYKLAEQPAVGVSSYDEASKQAAFCVWVKAVDTMFDETACGSGTCAIGVVQAWETGRSAKLDAIQPSGEVIRTEATYGPGAVNGSFIAGGVKVLYDGKLELA
ncbi:MAG TPA: hypothetical protein VMY99_04660 [Nevskiaceae bacterium]|nr:hypothetical protein [Nevskiaceae bacterium]